MADRVDGTGDESCRQLGRGVEVFDLDIGKGKPGLDQIVIGHDFQRIGLERADGFTLQACGIGDAFGGHQDAALYARTRHDLYGRTLIDQRKEIRIRNDRHINDARTKQRDHVGRSRGHNKFQIDAVGLGQLAFLGKEDAQIAQARSVCRLQRGRVHGKGLTRPHQLHNARRQRYGCQRAKARFQKPAARGFHDLFMRISTSVAHVFDLSVVSQDQVEGASAASC